MVQVLCGAIVEICSPPRLIVFKSVYRLKFDVSKCYGEPIPPVPMMTTTGDMHLCPYHHRNTHTATGENISALGIGINYHSMRTIIVNVNRTKDRGN
jgi:hypothetical protein